MRWGDDDGENGVEREDSLNILEVERSSVKEGCRLTLNDATRAIRSTSFFRPAIKNFWSQ